MEQKCGNMKENLFFHQKWMSKQVQQGILNKTKKAMCDFIFLIYREREKKQI